MRLRLFQERGRFLGIVMPLFFFVLYKVVALDPLGYFIVVILGVYLIFVFFRSKFYVKDITLALVVIPVLPVISFLANGEIELLKIYAKTFVLMYFWLYIVINSKPRNVFWAMMFFMFAELWYKSAFLNVFEEGLRRGGASLISGGLTEIHSSIILVVIISFAYSASLYQRAFVFVLTLLAQARTAMLLFFMLFARAKPFPIFIISFFILAGYLIGFERLSGIFRFNELVNADLSHNQVVSRKLEQLAIALKFDWHNIVLIDPFIHDRELPVDSKLWHTLLAPTKFFSSFGLYGIVMLWLFLKGKCLLRRFMVLSVAALAGPGVWQLFDASLGVVIYFDGWIYFTSIIYWFKCSGQNMRKSHSQYIQSHEVCKQRYGAIEIDPGLSRF